MLKIHTHQRYLRPILAKKTITSGAHGLDYDIQGLSPHANEFLHQQVNLKGMETIGDNHIGK
jgi:hypothetical protein